MTIVEPAPSKVESAPEKTRYPGSNPVAMSIRLRPPERDGMAERFGATDPPAGLELTKRPWVARLLASRKFYFALAAPTTLFFLLILVSGLVGTKDPTLNLTAITWYLWFCLIFVMLVVAGRAWCAMCPFGTVGDWIQRRSFFQRTQKVLGLGRKVPEPIARYGFLLSVGTFAVLTWFEEFYNIGGPGAPHDTSIMIGAILLSAAVFFVVFERRSFCRYICPLTALEGTIGSMGSAAGFRTKDRDVCLTCLTKDCMRGGEDGYGCPWYTWPGSAESNLTCGLCSECYRACPNDNVGFFVQRPLTSVVAPTRRRADVAWAVLLLWGMVLFQQVNATNGYVNLDGKLNGWLHFPQYPNPVDYIGVIAVLALVTAVPVWLIGRFFARPDATFPSTGPRFLERNNRFRAYLLPLAYGLIPVVGADYFARQLPKFFTFISTAIPSIGHPFGLGSTTSALYNTPLLAGNSLVIAEIVVVALGTLASVWATWRIAGRELAPISGRATGVKIASAGFAIVCGATAAYLYVLMHGAL
jgi:NosR/NirI family transcriptional regulator, nitrous oxide reductase regulator